MVEIVRHQCERFETYGELAADMESAVAVSQQNINQLLAQRAIGHRQIRDAIAVEIARFDAGGRAAIKTFIPGRKVPSGLPSRIVTSPVRLLTTARSRLPS